MNFCKLFSLLACVFLLFSITSCAAPKPTPPPQKLEFSVSATIDGANFTPGKPLSFSPLVPNQTQTKSLVITNDGDIDGLVTNLGIVQSGDIFNNGAVTVEIVTVDNAPITGTIVPVGKSVNAQIVLKTGDNLIPSLKGYIALDFDAVESEAKPVETTTEKEETP